MTTPHPHTHVESAPRSSVPVALWLPGLIVALGAVVATAHGLYAVALAAGTPQLIAVLYPVMTDGLAVVAYVATTRLSREGRRYAWTVVVLAAGLSGLAQATYLANGMDTVPTWLRFGVGAWPAIAVAIVAHLLYLIAGRDTPPVDKHGNTATVSEPAHADRRAVSSNGHTRPPSPTVAPDGQAADGDRAADGVQPPDGVPALSAAPYSVQPYSTAHSYGAAPFSGDRTAEPDSIQPPVQPSGPESVHRPDSDPDREPSAAPTAPGVRAERAAGRYRDEHGALPTAARLMDLAEVSRGTAGQTLKTLREQSAGPQTANQRPSTEAHP